MPAAISITRLDYTAAELRREAKRRDDADAARRMLAQLGGEPQGAVDAGCDAGCENPVAVQRPHARVQATVRCTGLLKQEVGLGHYEGRGWPGFHHHGILCIAVYGFLISEREMIPPSGPHCAGKLKKPAIPDSYRPRGAADPAPTSRSQLDRDAAPNLDCSNRKRAPRCPYCARQFKRSVRRVL